jgi:hypothetical protein
LYDVWWLNVREYRGIVYRKLVELSTSSSWWISCLTSEQ